MVFNNFQLKKLRSYAHSLNPVVMIGRLGLTSNVLNEINLNLNEHELIKVRIRVSKEQQKEMIAEITESTNSHLVQHIGHTMTLFRANNDSSEFI